MSLWERVKRALGRGGSGEREAAERLLLEADFGVAATEEILNRVAHESDGAFREALAAAVTSILIPPSPLPASDASGLARAASAPTVILVFGVNGVGKTTTVAKLANRLERAGRSTLLAAADTFRAGAVDQLKIWADRLRVPCVGASKPGADPAAVAFDAITAAKARGIDTVLVDTAGRLHTDEGLIDELRKVVRVTGKASPGNGAPHESLLVLDASVGQNALSQGRAFSAVPLTGLIVTKLDGTARGGAVVALRRELQVPVRFLGVGEGLDDLEAFDAETYARRLITA